MTRGPRDETMLFHVGPEKETEARRILREVHHALKDKGYNAVNQLVGYLLSGDPTYITSHRNARALIREIERDELLEELVRHYLATLASPQQQ
ncbi:MAG: IreB family regulatory phosphoprotein [Firmicutes bacterium]|nr:IreB family regulatory phosphoprotein [Bacillota bacterium]